MSQLLGSTFSTVPNTNRQVHNIARSSTDHREHHNVDDSNMGYLGAKIGQGNRLVGVESAQLVEGVEGLRILNLENDPF